ncbi:Rha family transcriptional regulator [Paraliobacillus ryukyuensis]|uniref:Rha family transcriptional regulator n=1 Tax=Paraliobacillus ryukyuensis TaxID=200904 RepID=UPI0009A89904|nr:Rha family transcriptional regulator [Paraliobacillus ryukyuensis]
MNQLKVVSMNGQLVTESRDVARMIDKKHAHLMRDIQGYKNVLDQNPNLDYGQNSKLSSDDFFIESTYQSNTGQNYKCFLLTRKGCDMVANKMTGQKGVLFTAEYVTRFEEMQKELTKNNVPQTQLEILQGTINQLVEQDKRVSKLENDINNISNIISISSNEWREKAVSILRKIAQQWTGVEPYRSVTNLSYERLEKRANCNLNIRVNNRKKNAIANGMGKTHVKSIKKIDVIAENKRLTEIYLQVIKEMAIQFGINIDDFKHETGIMQ